MVKKLSRALFAAAPRGNISSRPALRGWLQGCVLQSRGVYLLLWGLLLVDVTFSSHAQTLTATASTSLDLSREALPGPRLPPPLCSRAAIEPAIPPMRYGPERILDGLTTTSWVSEGPGIDERLHIDLGGEFFVETVEIAGYGTVGTEAPEENNRVRTLSVAPPDTSVDVPARTCYAPDTPKSFSCRVYGHAYHSLDLTVEEVYPARELAHLAVSEVKIKALPLSPLRVRAALALAEEATLSVIRNPGSGGQYLAAYTIPGERGMRAELAGINPSGDSVDVVWRAPIQLQMQHVPTLDLRMEPISFGGPPSLLLSYAFSGAGVTREYARVYVVGGGPAYPAWETSLLRGPESGEKVLLRFSSGKAVLGFHHEDYGFSLTEEIQQYMPAYRQFKPMGRQVRGARVTATTKGQGVGNTAGLLDGEVSRPWLVNGDGVDTTIVLTFDRPRRVTTVMLFPGVGAAGDVDTGEGGPSNARYTRPAEVELKFDNYTTSTTLDDSAEYQPLFEGSDGPGTAPTRTVTLTIKSVHPGIPGTQMAVGDLQVWLQDPG